MITVDFRVITMPTNALILHQCYLVCFNSTRPGWVYLTLPAWLIHQWQASEIDVTAIDPNSPLLRQGSTSGCARWLYGRAKQTARIRESSDKNGWIVDIKNVTISLEKDPSIVW